MQIIQGRLAIYIAFEFINLHCMLTLYPDVRIVDIHNTEDIFLVFDQIHIL